MKDISGKSQLEILKKLATKSHPYWKCSKCESRKFLLQTLAIKGGTWLALLSGLDTEEFSVLVCENCAFSEFYKVAPSSINKSLDLIREN